MQCNYNGAPNMDENKENERRNLLGDSFPNPAGEAPSVEDSMEDFYREGEQEQGTEPPPWKTLPFWFSFVSMNLCFIAALGVLPVQIQEWVVLLITSLGHLGYGVTAQYFEQHQDQLHIGKPTWKRPAFYASWVASMAAYGLGSGDPTAIEYSGQVAMVLGFFGVTARPWIQRRAMATLDNPVDFITRIMEALMLISRSRLREQNTSESIESEEL